MQTGFRHFPVEVESNISSNGMKLSKRVRNSALEFKIDVSNDGDDVKNKRVLLIAGQDLSLFKAMFELALLNLPITEAFNAAITLNWCLDTRHYKGNRKTRATLTDA